MTVSGVKGLRSCSSCGRYERHDVGASTCVQCQTERAQGPSLLEEADAELARDDRTSSWEPVDLVPILAGDYVGDRPDLCSRTDGHCLFYLRRTHWLHSPPEAGKTWLADLAITEVIEAGLKAVLFDFEDTPAATVDRLRRIGAGDARIFANLAYVRPEEPLTDSALRRLKSDVLPGALLVVIDATTPAMALDGLDPISTKDTASWLQRLPAAATSAGAAVLVLDHVVKSEKERGRWAIGSGQKLAIVTGAAYSLTARTPIAPGLLGRSTLNIAKDRPGAVRSASVGNVAGELIVDARDPEHLVVRIDPPVALTADETGLSPSRRWVLDALPTDPSEALLVQQIGDRVAEAGHPLQRATIQKALSELDELDLADAERPGGRSPHRWWSTSGSVP